MRAGVPGIDEALGLGGEEDVDNVPPPPTPGVGKLRVSSATRAWKLSLNAPYPSGGTPMMPFTPPEARLPTLLLLL
jgi:hypothetical protein